MKKQVLLHLLQIFFVAHAAKKQPNIVLIMADDPGWNDFGFHGGNQILTPNIDALAYNENSRILNRFYTQHTCTPSRSALMTGNYPIRNGEQGIPIDAGEDRHLPANMPTLAERLKGLGYSTHLVGKWHLGGAKREYAPNARGFDTFLGYHNGWVGYFDYQIQAPPASCNFSNVPAGVGNQPDLPCMRGYALYENTCPAYQYDGQYATTLFTDKAVEIIKNHNSCTKKPFFLFVSHLAPHSGKNGDELGVPNEQENDERFSYIEDISRRQYAGIMYELDKSVGKIMKTLAEKKLDNTIVIFMSDNGPQTSGIYRNAGSAYPLRGQKFTPLESAIRASIVAYSPLFKSGGGINNELMHITDLYPTLYRATGGKVSDLGKIDGVNQWNVLKDNQKTSRNHLLVNIDEVGKWSAIIAEKGQYKLINGSFNNGVYGKYYGEEGRAGSPPYDIQKVLNSDANKAAQILKRTTPLTANRINMLRNGVDLTNICDNEKRMASDDYVCKGLCLYDLYADPCETTDIAEQNPSMVQKLSNLMLKYWSELVPQKVKFLEVNANPPNCNNTWFFWKDETYPCFVNDPTCSKL